MRIFGFVWEAYSYMLGFGLELGIECPCFGAGSLARYPVYDMYEC
jgi:hypothetical protein